MIYCFSNLCIVFMMFYQAWYFLLCLLVELGWSSSFISTSERMVFSLSVFLVFYEYFLDQKLQP